MRLAAASKGFLSYCRHERRLSPLTLAAYESDIDDARRYFGSNAQMSKLCSDRLKDYLASLNGDRGLSVATVRRRFATLHGLFGWTFVDAPADNPFATWKPRLKKPRRLPKALSNAEVRHLLQSPGARDAGLGADTHLVILLLVATGLRISELCSLRVMDVSPDGSQLHVRGKGLRDRNVYVANAGVRAALKQLRKRGAATGQAEVLFCNRYGRALTPAAFRGRMKRLCKGNTDGKRITPHMLRHTAATLLIETGVDIRYVQKLLGHASIATTELYTHVADESLRRTLVKADIVGRVSRRSS
jgi:integrase/recombinase XerD